MGKEALRQACRDAGISYGKLNNDGMRAALKAAEQEIDEVDADEEMDEEDEAQETEVKSEPAQAQQVAVAPRAKVIGEVVQPKSLKIEKDRDERNGVRRPSIGSICREIWNVLDMLHGTKNEELTFKDVRDAMEAGGWQRNTAYTQFQRWKKFHGLMPRNPVEETED